MDYMYGLQGYVLGFSVATTIGVSGVLCLQNMMSGKRSIGLISAFAAALADMTCGSLVVFGIQSMQDLIMHYAFALKGVAGFVLVALGLTRLFGSKVFAVEHGQSRTVALAFVSVYFLAVLDPVSIADFVALSLGLTLEFNVVFQSFLFLMGMFLGSATWWFSLAFIIMYLQKSFSVHVLVWIQRLVGLGILALGIWTLRSAWYIL
ncbi:hypothetical protein KBD08_02715 [Candidatus Babeliales bacterium]|nr:hypothetical protein [Candidatus Babeliales bacterium]